MMIKYLDPLRKIFQLVFPSLVSSLVGGAVVTPVIAWMNYTAQDGPLFPPPLVAFFVVMPLIMVLFIVQAGALFYEWTTKRSLGTAWIGLGLGAGGGSGCLLAILLMGPALDGKGLLSWLAFLGLGLLLGLTGCGLQGIISWLFFRGKPSIGPD